MRALIIIFLLWNSVSSADELPQGVDFWFRGGAELQVRFQGFNPEVAGVAMIESQKQLGDECHVTAFQLEPIAIHLMGLQVIPGEAMIMFSDGDPIPIGDYEVYVSGDCVDFEDLVVQGDPIEVNELPHPEFYVHENPDGTFVTTYTE